VKLYEIIIKPESGFGTPLKGDTIFGHICWQVSYNPELLNGGLEKWIACYGERPFAVFSSAWPKIKKTTRCITPSNDLISQPSAFSRQR